MVRICDLRYEMELCGGAKNDIWRLVGEVEDHPNFPPGDTVKPSVPVSFDRENLVFKTHSGREYLIVSYKDSSVLDQIEKDVLVGNYERH